MWPGEEAVSSEAFVVGVEELVECAVVVSAASNVDAADKLLFCFDLRCIDVCEELDGSQVG